VSANTLYRHPIDPLSHPYRDRIQGVYRVSSGISRVRDFNVPDCSFALRFADRDVLDHGKIRSARYACCYEYARAYTQAIMSPRSRPRPPRLPVEFYWKNGPDTAPAGIVVRYLRGAQYERRVGPRDLLDVHEVAAALGTRHAFSIYRLVWDGRLKAMRRQGHLLIPLAAVAEYRASRRPRRRRGSGERWFVN
jgi:helix-turn-helix protein